jgi:hypothetical protein
MRRTALLRLLAAPVAAALLLAGCGSAEPSSSGSTKDSSSTASDGDSGSSSTDASALSTGDFGSRVYAAFQKAGTLHFELDTAVAGQRSTGSGEADLSGSTVASSVTQKLPGGAGQVQALLVDGFFFLTSPQFGPKWVKVDPRAKSGLGALVGQFGANSDPSRILKAMDSAATVTAKGSEQVDGVDTTKYHVLLPRKALVAALGTDARIASLLPENVEYDMWVDGDDLVRKQVSALKVAGQSSTTTITYSKFGDPVSITAPPAAQTTTKVPGLPG